MPSKRVLPLLAIVLVAVNAENRPVESTSSTASSIWGACLTEKSNCTYNPMFLYDQDTLVFRMMSTSDVYMFSDKLAYETCDKDRASLLARGTDPSVAKNENKYEKKMALTTDQSETRYYAGFGTHDLFCDRGVKLAVTVRSPLQVGRCSRNSHCASGLCGGSFCCLEKNLCSVCNPQGQCLQEASTPSNDNSNKPWEKQTSQPWVKPTPVPKPSSAPTPVTVTAAPTDQPTMLPTQAPTPVPTSMTFAYLQGELVWKYFDSEHLDDSTRKKLRKALAQMCKLTSIASVPYRAQVDRIILKGITSAPAPPLAERKGRAIRSLGGTRGGFTLDIQFIVNIKTEAQAIAVRQELLSSNFSHILAQRLSADSVPVTADQLEIKAGSLQILDGIYDSPGGGGSKSNLNSNTMSSAPSGSDNEPHTMSAGSGSEGVESTTNDVILIAAGATFIIFLVLGVWSYNRKAEKRFRETMQQDMDQTIMTNSSDDHSNVMHTPKGADAGGNDWEDVAQHKKNLQEGTIQTVNDTNSSVLI